MADDNLVLEHLRAIRASLDDVKATQAEHGQRLNRIEHAIAGLRRDQAGDAEAAVIQSQRIDRLIERLERVERRLELSE